jgi:hypothetical protein
LCRITTVDTYRHDIEQVTDRGLTQALLMEVGRNDTTALCDHTLPKACFTVTDCAPDIVLGLTTLKELTSQLYGQQIALNAINETGGEIVIGLSFAYRDGASNIWTRATSIGEEAARLIGLNFGLVVHVEVTSR